MGFCVLPPPRLGGRRLGVTALLVLGACQSRHLPAVIAEPISISPQDAEVQAGGTVLFKVTGEGPVAWSLAEGAAGGAIALDGRYTAPAAAGTFHVIAARAGARATAAVRVAASPIRVALSPAAADLETGGHRQFTASVSGADPRVSWAVEEGARGGTVNDSGLYLAPQAPGRYHLVAASVADPSRTAGAEIVVSASAVRAVPSTLTLSPLAATLGRGATLRFSAGTPGAQDGAVIWSSDCGAIEPDGTFRAPGQDGVCTVVARSAADPAQAASAAVAIEAEIGIAPSAVTLRAGGRVSFHGSFDFALREGAAGGSITPAGLYQAPADAGGTFHVTSGAAVATVTVLPPDLVDRGGPVAPATRTFAVFWGDPGAWSGDLRSTQEDLLRGLDGSAYLGLADQYLRGAVATTRFGGSFTDLSPPPASPGQADAQSIGAEACNALRTGGVTPAEGDWVVVYGGAELTPAPGFCAWHSYFNCGGAALLIAFVPNVTGSFGCLNLGGPGDCNSASAEANATASLTAHELLESITDPFVSTWTDDAGKELADKCEGEPRCVALSSGSFVLQAAYSNAAHACAP